MLGSFANNILGKSQKELAVFGALARLYHLFMLEQIEEQNNHPFLNGLAEQYSSAHEEEKAQETSARELSLQMSR